jgi:hypothetical protein
VHADASVIFGTHFSLRCTPSVSQQNPRAVGLRTRNAERHQRQLMSSLSLRVKEPSVSLRQHAEPVVCLGKLCCTRQPTSSVLRAWMRRSSRNVCSVSLKTSRRESRGTKSKSIYAGTLTGKLARLCSKNKTQNSTSYGITVVPSLLCYTSALSSTTRSLIPS